jgi:hypothetical protein
MHLRKCGEKRVEAQACGLGRKPTALARNGAGTAEHVFVSLTILYG